MWLMLQQNQPDDHVLATGETHTVREFVELAFSEIGKHIVWSNNGPDEKGRDAKTGDVLVEVDPRYFRPAEVDLLLGDASKARSKLGWTAKTQFRDLVKQMVQSDLKQLPLERRRRRTREE